MSAAPTPPETPRPAAGGKLDFDDPFGGPSADDSDRGWGEQPAGGDADLARFLDEKPPHHL